MSAVIYEKIRKARKEHACDYCGGLIVKGEDYDNSFVVDEGVGWTWKSHIHCNELIGLFEMNHGGDGVAQSEFCDWLDDYYRKSLSEELPPFPTLAPKAYKELTEAIPFSKRSTVEVDIRVGLWDEKGK